MKPTEIHINKHNADEHLKSLDFQENLIISILYNFKIYSKKQYDSLMNTHKEVVTIKYQIKMFLEQEE